MRRQRSRDRWSREAACTGDDRFIFEGKQPRKVIQELKKICDSCPVINECRNYAIVHDDNSFLAAMTKKELASLRKRTLEVVGYQAYSEGWLEPVNLLKKNHLAEFQELQALRQQRQQKTRIVPVESPKFDFGETPFVVPDLPLVPKAESLPSGSEVRMPELLRISIPDLVPN